MAFPLPEPEAGSRARRALLEALRANPGATVSDLARALGVSHSTTTYHLRRLEKGGAVVTVRERGRLHAFLNGQASPRERTRTICGRLARAEEVLARVPRESPAPLGAIALGLPMSKPGVIWHLKRLATLGLVEVAGPPRSRRYRALG